MRRPFIALLPAVVGLACASAPPPPAAPPPSPAPAWTEVLATPRPARGELMLTGFTLDGEGIDAGEVRVVLVAGVQRAQPCFQSAFATGSSVPTRVRVDLTIDRGGRATSDASPPAEGASPNSERTAVECLVDALRQQRYPAPESERAEVHALVDFVRLR